MNLQVCYFLVSCHSYKQTTSEMCSEGLANRLKAAVVNLRMTLQMHRSYSTTT